LIRNISFFTRLLRETAKKISGKRSARSRVFKSLIVFAFIVFFVYSNLSARLHTHTAEVAFLDGKRLIVPLIDDITSAEHSIDMTIYMFKADRDKPADTELLLLALENAAKRGVRVRVVFDIENDESSFLNKANRETGTDLAKAGAVVMYDSPKKRLHTKMTVIDRRIVYSGSHNYTYSAFNYNDEVTMRLESESLAAEATEYVEKFFR